MRPRICKHCLDHVDDAYENANRRDGEDLPRWQIVPVSEPCDFGMSKECTCMTHLTGPVDNRVAVDPESKAHTAILGHQV